MTRQVFEMAEEIGRSRRLIANIQREELKEIIIQVLPQGHMSGLDADMVDGLHATEIIAKRVPGGIGGAAGSGGGPHAASHQPGGADDLLGGISGVILPTTDLLIDIGEAFCEQKVSLVAKERFEFSSAGPEPAILDVRAIRK